MRKVQSFISTLLVAAIATLLIWTWAADRTREVRTLTGTVLLRPADATKQFVDPAQPQSVSLTLKASPATITKLQTLLEQGLVLPIGSGPLTGEPGQRMLDLAPIIDQCPEVLATDASVVSVRPDRLEVRVGAMVPVRMSVVAAASLVMLRGDAEVQPAEVQALVPEPAAEAASKEQAEAIIDAKGLADGTQHVVDAPLRLPDSLKLAPSQVVFTPDRVKVNFTVAGKSRSFTLPTVRVEVAGAPEDLKGFEVSFPDKGDLIRDVVLSAPGDALLPIENGQARVVAVVHLSPEELSKRITQKTVSAWVVPPGVQVESASGQRPSEVIVPLKIEPRTVPAAEPAGPAAAASTPPNA